MKAKLLTYVPSKEYKKECKEINCITMFIYYLRCLLLRMVLCKLMVISAFWRATSSRNLEVPLLPAACTSFPYIWTTSKSFLKHGLREE